MVPGRTDHAPMCDKSVFCMSNTRGDTALESSTEWVCSNWTFSLETTTYNSRSLCPRPNDSVELVTLPKLPPGLLNLGSLHIEQRQALQWLCNRPRVWDEAPVELELPNRVSPRHDGRDEGFAALEHNGSRRSVETPQLRGDIVAAAHETLGGREGNDFMAGPTE